MKHREEQAAPPLAGRLWLLGSLALVLAPPLTRLPLWLGAGCVLVAGWRLAREFTGWALPPKAVRVTLTLAAFGAVLNTYHGILGREGGVALLSMMLCLKLLELRTLRDAAVVVFLGYFLVAAGFLYDQSLFTGAYMFAVVLALTTALVMLNHPEADLGRWRRYLALAGGMLVQALPMAVLLFVLFPRVPGPLWGLPADAFGRTGLSGDMSLENITELADSHEVAFRVRFDGTPPPADRLYWRGPVLWHTDGRRWSQTGIHYQPPPYEALDGAVGYTVTLEPHHQRWLFALDLPATVPEGAGITGAYQLLANKRVDARLRYRAASYTRYRTGPLRQVERRLALALPEEPNPRTQRLGREWRAAGLSDAALVARALAYFREQPFYYTRRPPDLGPDPVDGFLFSTRRGFCEHYAAAFVTLMRSAGVPARVVTGYQGGELNPVGAYLVVRQSDAHAWAEVWLAGQGWVRVDPTAVIPAERVEAASDWSRFRAITTEGAGREGPGLLGSAWRRLRYGWDAANNAWNQWVLTYNTERQKGLMQRLGLGDITWRGMAALLFGSLAVVMMAVAAYLHRRRPGTVDPALRLYQAFCNRLARRGLPRRPGEGPLDYAARVNAVRPEIGPQVDHITGLYAAMRYGGVGAPADLQRLRRAVAGFRP